MGQFGFLYLPQKAGPRLAADQPAVRTGQRIFSLTNVVHLGFGLLKVLLIVGRRRLVPVGRARPADEPVRANRRPRSPRTCFSVLLWTSLKIGGALAVLALFDYGYQYWKHEQDLRMTTQELKEEIKTQQGDPQIAARRKQIQRQMVLHRLSTTIPKADVIVTNPTELADRPAIRRREDGRARSSSPKGPASWPSAFAAWPWKATCRSSSARSWPARSMPTSKSASRSPPSNTPPSPKSSATSISSRGRSCRGRAA